MRAVSDGGEYLVTATRAVGRVCGKTVSRTWTLTASAWYLICHLEPRVCSLENFELQNGKIRLRHSSQRAYVFTRTA